MKLNISVIIFLLIILNGTAQEYPVLQSSNKINNSPWYGLGLSNLNLPSAGANAVQVAGYYGLIFKTKFGSLNIHENGKIGIGTTNPKANLHVEGRTAVGLNGVLNLDWTHEANWGGSSNKWAGYIGFNASRNSDDAKDYYSGSNRYTSKGVLEGSNYGFRWLYRNHEGYDSDGQHVLSEFMRLTNNGDLGIGTASPDSRLTVKGIIHAEEVKVDLSVPVPDYVFKEGYDLMSLEEIQKFIHQYGHLPKIPSAKEMEGNGVELGVMNMRLLEKIEELTLHIIEQEKRIKKLEDEK
ncbi:tail fiber protein [Sediminicola sp. YIK13]|uniref:tail fiber protein n=1 Tax=Sediminicola sp. YIK13 TaxID=1453352 RepID=UPI0007853465|nr:tail fiber protein [Sediminicola sp. YIK13]